MLCVQLNPIVSFWFVSFLEPTDVHYALLVILLS